MLIDRLSEFADSVTLSQLATGRAVIGSTIDLGNPPRDIGAGKPLFLIIVVEEAITSGSSATVAFELVSDSVNPPAADASETAHWISDAIPKASLIAGYRMVVPLPSVNPEYERYLGLQQNVAVAALTGGKVSAFLSAESHGWRAYPEGQN